MELEKEMQVLANRITRLETLLTGANGDAGLFSVVKEIKERQKEIREEQKKQTRFQNLMIGAIIIINLIAPFAIKAVFSL